MKAAALLLALGFLAMSARGEEPKTPVAEQLVFRTDWKGEVIALPASFAPEMTLKGIEEIRFAPGMFDPESESFFTYVFVFSVSEEQKLTEEVIRDEMLAYYRGLAKSVLGGKDVKVDTGKFTFELGKSEGAREIPESIAKPGTVTGYAGKLDWIEPFATAKPQVLHFELQAWADARTGRNYLFVCVSPKPVGADEGLWKEMRGIRQAFSTTAPAPAKD